MKRFMNKILLAYAFFLKGESQLLNTFVTKLYGANEVLYPGDPDGNGDAKLIFDSKAGSLFYDIQLSRITEPTAINIVYGSVAQTAGAASPDSTATVLTLINPLTKTKSPRYGEYDISGVAAVPIPLVNAIFASPSLYYLQVYTIDYVFGAVRGQLQTVDSSVQVSYSDSNAAVWSGNGT